MTGARPWAWPLVLSYWAGLRLKDGLRRLGVLPIRRLGWPVASVGSLSAGGAGKTPVVIALTELVRASGEQVDVLTRGYGRDGEALERVDLDAPDAALRFGDEPVLIAQRTAVPVWVGGDRFASGTNAEAAFVGRRGIHVLDDGFQHRQLARRLDIVLLTAEDLEDGLLPAGNRREPLSALRRADVIVLRVDEADLLRPRLHSLIERDSEIWVIRRTLTVPRELAREARPLLAFCGIARPGGFFEMLRQSDLTLIDEIAFPDHHRYTTRDVSRMARSCHLEGWGFITTEKDAVKLGPELRQILESAGDLHVARLEAVFLDPERVTQVLKERLG